MNKIFNTILVLLILTNCESKDDISENNLINLFEPTFNLNLARLDQLGFEWVENVDAYLLEKTINDTLIYYFLGDADDVNHNTKPLTYYVDLRIKSLLYFESIVEKRNSIVVARKEDKYLTNLIIKNLDNNLFFTCILDKEDTSHILIRFDYPIMN